MRRLSWLLLGLLPLLGSAETDKINIAQAPEKGILLTQQALKKALSHGPWPAPITFDSSNRLSGNKEAIALGRRLFFSTRLSADNTKSCVSCHAANEAFASGRVIRKNILTLDRNTPSLFNVRYNRWFGWDGANDNLWAQSMRPIVSKKEMSLPKETLRHVIKQSTFLAPYQRFFGEIANHSDDLVLVNIGKALAAFQETLITKQTPFDDFRDAIAHSNWIKAAQYPASAQRGLSVFLGKGNCHTCHSGPLFTNGEFHNIGLSNITKAGDVDSGRQQGIIHLKQSRFTLASDYSDDLKKSGASVSQRVTSQKSNIESFRVPSLRGVANTAPYMHNGSLTSLEDVVNHYLSIDVKKLNANSAAIFKPLNLTKREASDLIAFLQSLSE